jgi:hypothetical protein
MERKRQRQEEWKHERGGGSTGRVKRVGKRDGDGRGTETHTGRQRDAAVDEQFNLGTHQTGDLVPYTQPSPTCITCV